MIGKLHTKHIAVIVLLDSKKEERKSRNVTISIHRTDILALSRDKSEKLKNKFQMQLQL